MKLDAKTAAMIGEGIWVSVSGEGQAAYLGGSLGALEIALQVLQIVTKRNAGIQIEGRGAEDGEKSERESRRASAPHTSRGSYRSGLQFPLI